MRKFFDALGAQRLRQQYFAQGNRFGLGHGLQVMPNFGTCSTGAYKAQPSRVRLGAGVDHHFHHIAVFELGSQRHLFAANAGADGAIPHVAVDGVGKVHHGGATRHGHDLALGREHVHGVGEQVNFDVIPELGSVAGFVLYIEQRLQPLATEPI